MSGKIVENNVGLTFESIEIGEFFCWGENYFMKLERNYCSKAGLSFNAICINLRECLTFFGDKDSIRRVDSFTYTRDL